MEQRKSKYDVELGEGFELCDNKYRNRRNVREMLNEIGNRFFKKSRNAGWEPYIRADMHVIDRLHEREFPFEEFLQIVAKLVSRDEGKLLKLVESRFNSTETIPLRINCYGHGAWMIAVTISIHTNIHEGDNRSFHVNIRTCYKERNMIFREREIGVEKIWTRGMPSWMKNPPARREPCEMVEINDEK